VKATDLARAEALFASGTVAQTARDNARAAHLGQRQKVQGIKGVLALFPTQRAVQTEQIAVYQTNLATAQLNLARSQLTLPFPARVAAHTVEVGQFLKAGQTAANLDGIDQAEVAVQVPMNDLRKLLQQGQSQSGTLPLDPNRMGDALRDLGLTAQVRLRLGGEIVIWPASVDRISDGIDPRTGTVGVIVQVDDAYGQVGDGNRPPLTKGMFVDVLLSAPPITGVVLPRSALHDGQIYVADADNRLRMVAAQPRVVQGGIALFTAGIVEGSQIVLSNPSPLIEGLLLNVHPDNDLMARLLAEDAAK
jgi:membrane fusion protein, multidrug efflux system